MTPSLRPGRDADGDAMRALIGACWSEHPGCVMDPDETAYLRVPASYYEGQGGRLLVAEDEGALVATIAWVPAADHALELKGLYVAPAHRGTGLAQAMLDAIEAMARAQAASHLLLWTDTRFTRAHRFYERRGFVAAGAIRTLGDRSSSLEYPYAKPMLRLAVEALDGVAAASAVPALADLLVACVDAGASVSFLPPLDLDAARAFYRGVARDVAAGRRHLFAGWLHGTLSGTILLDPAWQQNQPHRAEIAKLLVHPGARRRGLGDALLTAAEMRAHAIGRTLLTLDTADAGASSLYRRHGWISVGTIPGYAIDGAGRPLDTTMFWRALA